MKQKNAFPPNFIHSLDSSHMMLTSLHAEQAGITFVSVHDCYWTHPSTVEVMNRVMKIILKTSVCCALRYSILLSYFIFSRFVESSLWLFTRNLFWRTCQSF